MRKEFTTAGRRAADPTTTTLRQEMIAILLAMVCAGSSNGKRVQA